MPILLILILLLVFSFLLALRSMKDFEIPGEVKSLFRINKIRGTILFFKGKTKHYKS